MLKNSENLSGIAAVDAGGESGVAFNHGPAAILNDAEVEGDGGMQPRKNTKKRTV